MRRTASLHQSNYTYVQSNRMVWSASWHNLDYFHCWDRFDQVQVTGKWRQVSFGRIRFSWSYFTPLVMISHFLWFSYFWCWFVTNLPCESGLISSIRLAFATYLLYLDFQQQKVDSGWFNLLWLRWFNYFNLLWLGWFDLIWFLMIWSTLITGDFIYLDYSDLIWFDSGRWFGLL